MIAKSLTVITGKYYSKARISKVSSLATSLAGSCNNNVNLRLSHLSTSKILQPLQFYSTQTNLKNDLKIKEEKVIKVTNTSDVKDFSRAEKLKRAVKEYGSTVIIFHVGISLISLGTCYLLVTMGLDTTALLNMIGDWTANNKIATNAGTFALAYGIHKIFAPVRIVITLTSVPFIVKYLRNVGFLKK